MAATATRPAALDPVMKQFAARVRDAYGPRLERLVLFGSRARGDHHAESDYDVAVFIHDAKSRWDELGVLDDIVTDFLVEPGEMITALPFPAGKYADGSPLMRDVTRDGIDL